jgi:O-antigen/teichoic acid export membrane protein
MQLKTLKSKFLQNNSLKQVFLKNTFWLSAAEFLSKCFKFFLVPLSARLLGPENFGIYGYATTLMATYFLFSDFGLGSLFLREYPKGEHPKSKLLANTLVIKSVLITLAVIGASTGYVFVKDPAAKTIFFIVLITTTLDHIKRIWGMISEAELKMEYRATALLLETGTTTLLGIYLLKKSATLTHLATSYAVGTGLGFLLMLFYIRNYLPKKWELDFSIIKKMLRLSLPFLLTSSVSIFLLSTDTLMVKWLLGATQVGYQQAAIKIIHMGAIIPYIINTAIYPMAAKFASEKAKLSLIIKQGLGLLLMIAIPITIAGILLGKSIIHIAFSSAYAPAIIVFQILLISLFIDFSLYLLNNTLLILNQHVRNLQISTLALVCNISLNLILIPRMGIIGSAIATLIAKSLDLALTALLFKKMFEKESVFPKYTYIHVISGIVMGATIVLIHPHTGFILTSTIAALVYITTLVILKEPQVVRLMTLLTKDHKVS